MAKIDKARYWTAVLYPENMLDDWELNIGDIVQYPYAYCKHTSDRDSKSEHRKDHVHLILAFPNTTTYKHALSVFSLLSAEGRTALNKCEAVVGIRNVYDYLIHDTDSCRKQQKELYAPSERITGNNFDIGAYEQIGVVEKNEIFLQLCECIRVNNFMNYMDFYEHVIANFEDINFIEIMRSYSGHFERLTKGNFQRWQQRGYVHKAILDTPADTPDTLSGPFSGPPDTLSDTLEPLLDTPDTLSDTPDTLNFYIKSCPFCGSFELKKNGTTVAKSTRWRCKDCGKSFV